MKARAQPLSLVHLLSLWCLLALAYVALRFWLKQRYGLPPLGPGTGVMLTCLVSLGWLAVEPPGILPGGTRRLWKAGMGLGLLFAGQALVYYRVEGKDLLLALAYAAMILGAGLLLSAKRFTKTWAVVLGMALLGAWLGQGQDIIHHSGLGRLSAFLSVLLLAAVLFISAWALREREAAQPEPVLGLSLEAGLFCLIIALALALRFWQLGSVPQNFWYDEVNLARATQERVLDAGRAPWYVAEQVENPGAYLWVGAAAFKVFGVSLIPYRYLAAIFGVLALFPFFGLARLWLGARWALVATAMFAAMRWTLIPQRIGFMSGFALFWMLSAFYFLWCALLRGRPWQWLAAGVCLGANLHTYTPARAVPVLCGIFLIWHWRHWRGHGWRAPAALAAGFALSAGPMIYYALTHLSEYLFRSQQVSVMSDVRSQGWGVLWSNFAKHLLMFAFRGDFNARHNLHFYPQLDFLMAAVSLPALLNLHAQAASDWRARFALLWFWPLLAAGIFSMAVEAPQGHRSILVAPLLPLAIAWAAKCVSQGLGSAFVSGIPLGLKLAGAALLFGSLAFNAHEYFNVWAKDAATWRGFSPRASAVARRVVQVAPEVEICVTPAANEYQFHGYEIMAFARFALHQQGRSYQILRLGMQAPGFARAQPPPAVFLVWAESDQDITRAFSAQFPDIAIERPADPQDPEPLFLAAEVPWNRIPRQPVLDKARAPLLWH